MKTIPHIIKIVEIKGFKIKLLWNTSEIRLNDFTSELDAWKKDSLYKPLTKKTVFESVTISNEGTLEWKQVEVTFTFGGMERTEPLELDKIVLYNSSILLEKYEPNHIGKLLKTAREKAGLTQAEVAKRAGTTRNYISRIENGNSDIKVGTLQRILSLGMDRSLEIV